MTDTTLYDRQSRTYGLDATYKLQSSTIYIIGLKNGYASEICKNLALSGVKRIIFIGNELIDDNDKINCMFYRNENGYCWQALSKHIKKINNEIIIEHLDDTFKFEKFSCVIIINKTYKEVVDYNMFTQFYNCKLVYMIAGGLAGSIFVDTNENHQVYDLTGESKEMVPIKDIIIDNIDINNIKIVCGKHNFTYGDNIKLTNLVGENLSFFKDNIFTIIDTTNYSITINKNNDNMYIKFINGSIEYVKKIKMFNQHNIDYTHPSDIYKNLNNMLVNNKCEDEKINKSFKYTFQPVISIMGGFVSCEAIKLLTNKYTPINQWYDWTDFDVIKDYNNIDEEIKIMNECLNKQIVMIGCGALGCEWLKNLVMIGFNNIKIIDPDHIEKSNLSRQFLFRNEDIGKSKAITAIKTIKEIIINNINLISYDKKLTSEDIDFSSNVFKDAEIVISALDNIEARKYVDSICFDKCLPLFESGTMGMKCNTLPIIPYLTETYSCNNTDSDENQNEFPACTIKNFPNCIQHTIHWARDYFETLKNNTMEPTVLCHKLFIDNINELLEQFPSNHIVDDQLFWSHGKLCPKVLDINDECYSKFIEATININKLNNFEFDKDNDNHIEWITTASNCRASNYGINNESNYTTKGIVGKIIPAVATTTSTTVGLIAIELLKYMNNIYDITKYRSWFMNMADNTIIYSEPNNMKPIIINNQKLNGWTKFKYNKDTLLNEFIDYYKQLFNVEIEMILYNSSIIYAEFMIINNDKKLSTIFHELDIDINNNEVSLTLLSGDNELPLINVLIQ
jgi:ubiquitin-activating enzyme E1